MSTRRQLIGAGAGAASVALVGVAASSLRTLAQDGTPTAGTDTENSAAAPVVGTPVLRPTIDLVRAQEIALEGNPGTVVTKVELDGDDGVLEYSVELDNGTEVNIDATSGVVIKTEPSDSGDEDHSHDERDDDGHDDQSDDGGDDGHDDDDEENDED